MPTPTSIPSDALRQTAYTYPHVGMYVSSRVRLTAKHAEPSRAQGSMDRGKARSGAELATLRRRRSRPSTTRGIPAVTSCVPSRRTAALSPARKSGAPAPLPSPLPGLPCSRPWATASPGFSAPGCWRVGARPHRCARPSACSRTASAHSTAFVLHQVLPLSRLTGDCSCWFLIPFRCRRWADGS